MRCCDKGRRGRAGRRIVCRRERRMGYRERERGKSRAYASEVSGRGPHRPPPSNSCRSAVGPSAPFSIELPQQTRCCCYRRPADYSLTALFFRVELFSRVLHATDAQYSSSSSECSLVDLARLSGSSSGLVIGKSARSTSLTGARELRHSTAPPREWMRIFPKR